ncbi:MAG TPA: glutamate formiminotransferase [Candidatus Dormibacteraeota bacterium]
MTPLFEAVPNISEGRRPEVVDSIAGATSGLLDAHPDPVHNRAVISLAGFEESVVQSLVGIVDASARLIDLRVHRGVHPRVGAADVLPVVPLRGATLEGAAEVARAAGARIWSELRVPVFFYGAAGDGRTLADIRAGRVRPDLGGELHPSAGAACVGARWPLVAYNVLLTGADAASAAALARAMRARQGGPPGVQALAFDFAEGRWQLSMNLVDLELTPPAAALEEVRRRAAQLGLGVGDDEVVGLCPAPYAPARAAGRILEGRLAAAGARRAATAARARGGDEMQRLAHRLEVAAGELAATGAAQEDLLAAAEAAAAVTPVLAAGNISDAEAEALLEAAARGLRAALGPEVLAARAERVRLLDRRLP